VVASSRGSPGRRVGLLGVVGVVRVYVCGTFVGGGGVRVCWGRKQGGMTGSFMCLTRVALWSKCATPFITVI